MFPITSDGPGWLDRINAELGGGDLTPLLVSEASRVPLPLPLQHTPLATCLSTSCVDGRVSSLIPTVWNKEFTESAQDYMSRTVGNQRK